MRRVIRKHLRDFVAVAALFLIAIAVSGYILGQQRLNLPGWVPLVGKDFYTVKAEFSNAQALTPGEGQTVNVAGVPVGEIGKVELKNGVALVTLKIKRKYAPIYRDATMLLRPKTGLKDMTVQMDPGDPPAGKLPDGGTVPIGNTAPDVNPDEVLSALDTDTRTYLQILLNAGARAFGKQGYPADLRETFKRFEPTNRDLAKITGQLSKRRANIARVVHNLRSLTQELGTKDRQIASLVDSSNANFRALASQDARIRESLQLLPGTLQTAQSTLGKADRLATYLGPTLQALRPTARALGPALRSTRPFLRDTRPIIQNQLRPFAREAGPTVRDLRKAAATLGPTTPKLTRVFKVVNSALNELAYNPPGEEEGFLFWNSWVNHNGASVFSTQDAHGPIRRGLIVASCQSLELLENIVKGQPALRTLSELLNSPTSTQVCPKQISPKADG
ncbi:MAG TPA: MlaD family protein [Thermoleophilaceae bacterium]|jgi:phospholipid/cholesterol/gamma-HCH transport system substrate-binding protein